MSAPRRRCRHRLGIAGAVLATAAAAPTLPPTPALAQQAAVPATSAAVVQLPCHDYREVRRQLGDRYEEAPVSIGAQSNGNVVQVFASTRSRTWTIVSTAPNGTACILAAGKGWEVMQAMLPDAAT